MPTLAEGLHVVVKPCDLRRSLLFREIAILAVPRSPCLQNILLMTVQASSMPPRRPWPSRRRYCPGPRRAAIISGPTGGRRCPRYGALLKRGLGVRSSWPRSGSFNGLPRPGVARELPFKSHFKGEAKSSLCVKRETGIEKRSGRDLAPRCGKNDRGRPSDLTQAVFENYNAKPPRKHLPSFEATHSNIQQ